MDAAQAQQLRELGFSRFYDKNADKETRAEGLRMIIKASGRDPEAMVFVATHLRSGLLTVPGKDAEEFALWLLYEASCLGCLQARAQLNALCWHRYMAGPGAQKPVSPRPNALLGFDGKPIRIDRRGLLTPIDASLTSRNGEHTLTLRTNVCLLRMDDLPNEAQFLQAVEAGLRAWEGTYQVFGGQKLTIRLELTFEEKLFDNLWIVPFTGSLSEQVQKQVDAIGTPNRRAQIRDMITNRRSFAAFGLRWSVNSRKMLYIQSTDGSFNDHDEIADVVKHEFGHALGLGDLYASQIDHLPGVERGTFEEIDCYAVDDRLYHLVMCDHHGPVSNNDVEMVILAFQKNKIQLFQKQKNKGKISQALGRGN